MREYNFAGMNTLDETNSTNMNNERNMAMNEIKVFENEQFGQVRTTVINGEPWFVAVDVCKALELNNNRMALERLDKDEKGVSLIDTLGGKQEMSIVNEPGLYTLVLGSRKPEAKAFKRWITHDVIPSIRKHGMYATEEVLDRFMHDPASIGKVFLALAEEREARKVAESKVELMAPKADYYDNLVDSKLYTNFRDTGKELHMRQKEFINWLIEHEYIYRDAKNNLKPYAQYIVSERGDTAGYFVLKETHGIKSSWSGVQTLVTVKGKEHFIKQLAKDEKLAVIPAND